VRPSAIVWLEFSVSVIVMENYTNSEMTDMVLCYGSADGVALRAQVLYREKFPARWYFSIAFVSKSFVSDSNVRRST
jgi:hypothetical protein